MSHFMPLTNRPKLTWRHIPVFVVLYVTIDWVSYIEPLFRLNITAWNPAPALGFVYWLRYGKQVAIPWFLALMISEFLTRGMPEGLATTTLLSMALVVGYGAIGEALRRYFQQMEIFHNRKMLLIWLGIIVCGTQLNSLIYISVLNLLGHIPQGQWIRSCLAFWIGDIVAIVLSMPLLWLLSSAKGRGDMRRVILQWETAGYIALSLGLLWVVFGSWRFSEFRHFYFLFIPMVWAAARQGVAGASLEAFFLQIAFMAIVIGMFPSSVPVFEMQLLATILGTAAIFMGVVVDEHRQVSEELKQTIRLASAGEMAAALAHEINQPLAALSAYAKAGEHLLARGEKGELLQKALQQITNEAGRVTEVVRRLRDFFRSGAMQFEFIDLNRLVTDALQPYLQRAKQQQTVIHVQDIPGVSLFIDALQIEVILHNLLTNALESVAMIQEEGKRMITISASLLSVDRICITVEDSGSGVSQALSQRLFQSFFSTKSTGLGLGLVVSKAIAEAHGGSLWAETADHGIFRLMLPISERDKYAV